VRSFPLALAAAGALAAALLATPATAAVAPQPWSGYVVYTGSHTSTVATFTVPALNCTTRGGDIELWTALDGYGSATLEQVGVVAQCTSGVAAYTGFTDLYPNYPVDLNTPVHAGDSVTGAVGLKAGTATLTFTDNTTGYSLTRTGRTSGAGASAEVVAECDTLCPAHPTLVFTGAKVDGGSLGASGAQPITGAPGKPSPLTAGGTAFTIPAGAGGVS
jgi:hypothetical protein